MLLRPTKSSREHKKMSVFLQVAPTCSVVCPLAGQLGQMVALFAHLLEASKGQQQQQRQLELRFHVCRDVASMMAIMANNWPA